MHLELRSQEQSVALLLQEHCPEHFLHQPLRLYHHPGEQSSPCQVCQEQPEFSEQALMINYQDQGSYQTEVVHVLLQRTTTITDKQAAVRAVTVKAEAASTTYEELRLEPLQLQVLQEQHLRQEVERLLIL